MRSASVWTPQGGRPNPIVPLGLFTDKDGIPLAFCINLGNTAETTTLNPLEDKLQEKFGMSKVVVCTDGGLESYENKLNDHIGERVFITVQSLKKLENIPTYTKTDLTNNLHGSAGFRTNTQIVSKQTMKKNHQINKKLCKGLRY